MDESDIPLENPEQSDPPATAVEETEEPATPAAQVAEDPQKVVADRVEGISKSLQAVTQVLAHIQKKIDKGEELTNAEKGKIQDATEDTKRLRKQLENYDATGDTGNSEEGIDKTATKAALLALKRLDAVEAENKVLREERAATAPGPEEAWVKLEAKNPQARTIWKEAIKTALSSSALKNAQQMLQAGEITQAAFDKILKGRASELFHGKVAVAAKAAALPIAGQAPPTPPRSARSAHLPGAQSAAQLANGSPSAQTILDRLSY